MVLHISVHSFTPRWKGKIRKTEIGFLCHPHREKEKFFCQEWRNKIHQHVPKLTIHLNRPYRGNTDGLTESLRKIFSEENYLGIELELNQNIVRNGSRHKIVQILIESLETLLEEFSV